MSLGGNPHVALEFARGRGEYDQGFQPALECLSKLRGTETEFLRKSNIRELIVELLIELTRN